MKREQFDLLLREFVTARDAEHPDAARLRLALETGADPEQWGRLRAALGVPRGEVVRLPAERFAIVRDDAYWENVRRHAARFWTYDQCADDVVNDAVILEDAIQRRIARREGSQ